MNTNITVKEIIAAMPKANCKAVFEISLHMREKASDKIYEDIKYWVKEVLEGKIEASNPRQFPFIGSVHAIGSLDGSDDYMLGDNARTIRWQESMANSTSRGVQLGMWRVTTKIAPAYRIYNNYAHVVPSAGLIKRAYNELVNSQE